jgi:hypothetical protein
LYINWAFCTRFIWLIVSNSSVFQGFRRNGVNCLSYYIIS